MASSTAQQEHTNRASLRGPVRVFEKGRVYVRHPGLAPEGVPVHEGPRGGIYYETDPETERKIINQYAVNAWEMASGEEKVALRQYTGAAFRYINRFLREGETPEGYDEHVADNARKFIGLLTQLANRNPLPMSMELYRAMKKDAFEWATGLQVGTQFIDRGFVSTSPEPTDTYADNTEVGRSVYLKINAPQGLPAIPVGDQFDNEIILPPGLSYEVTDLSYDPVDGYTVEVEVIGYDPVDTDPNALINQYDRAEAEYVQTMKRAAEVLPGFRYRTSREGPEMLVESFDINDGKADVIAYPGTDRERKIRVGLGAILYHVDISEDGPFRLQQLFPGVDIVRMFGRQRPARLSKAKVYVRSPQEAPPGATLQQGPRGGTYYESSDPAVQQTDERAYEGQQREVEAPITKQEAGELGEAIVVSYLKSLGLSDARPLNSRRKNFPVDLVQDHGVIEVKTGLVSNSNRAQQWRATIGQPGKKEAEWLKTANPAEKKAWNDRKREEILLRKKSAMDEIAREIGAPMKGKTMTVILDPDNRTADLYEFDGFHLRIGWNTPEAEAAYLGSFRYE